MSAPAEADAPPRSHRPARAFLEPRRQRDVGRAKRGDEAEQDAAHAGHERGKGPDAPIERHLEACRPPATQGRHQRDRNPSGDQQSEAAADDREQQAFGQQLAHDARARRPDRDAHRHFAAPRASPCEQQVRQVGARDEQHDRHHDPHRQQRIAHGLAALELSPRAGPDTQARQLRRRQRRPSCGDALLHQEVERRLRPGRIDAGLEAPHHQHPPERGILRRLFRVCLNEPPPHGERQRHVRRVADLQRAFEPARGDARDRHRDAVDDQRFADRVGRPGETPLPERVADHRDRRSTRPIVGRDQGPAGRRRHAEHVEVVARHELRAGDFRAAVARQVDPGELGEPEDVRVRRGVRAQRFEGREGERRAHVLRADAGALPGQVLERPFGPGRPIAGRRARPGISPAACETAPRRRG